MEDLDYKAMQDSVSGRLATAMLRFIMLARARRVAPSGEDRDRIEWLKSLLLRSLGGARRVSLDPEALAPGLEPQRGRVDEELESFAALRRFSGSESPTDHAAWVQAGVSALDKLAADGWRGLDGEEDVRLVEDSLLPLLRWMSGANDRGARDAGATRPLVGA